MLTGRPRANLAWLWRIAPAFLWAVAIFVVSDQPDLPRAPLSLIDLLLKKIAHLTEYAIFALLVYRALGPTFPQGECVRSVVAWTLAVVYAASDELHQSFVPGRTATPIDVGIDAIGALLGLGVWAAVRRRRASTTEPLPPAPSPTRRGGAVRP